MWSLDCSYPRHLLTAWPHSSLSPTIVCKCSLRQHSHVDECFLCNVFPSECPELKLIVGVVLSPAPALLSVCSQTHPCLPGWGKTIKADPWCLIHLVIVSSWCLDQLWKGSGQLVSHYHSSCCSLYYSGHVLE